MLATIRADAIVGLGEGHLTTTAIGNEVDANHVFHFLSLLLSLFSFSAPSISSVFLWSTLESYNTVRFLSSKYHARKTENILHFWHAVCWGAQQISCQTFSFHLARGLLGQFDVNPYEIKTYSENGGRLRCKSLRHKGLRQEGGFFRFFQIGTKIAGKPPVVHTKSTINNPIVLPKLYY